MSSAFSSAFAGRGDGGGGGQSFRSNRGNSRNGRQGNSRRGQGGDGSPGRAKAGAGRGGGGAGGERRQDDPSSSSGRSAPRSSRGRGGTRDALGRRQRPPNSPPQGRGAWRGGGEASAPQRAFKLAQTPVFRGILGGASDDGLSTSSPDNTPFATSASSGPLGGMTPLPRSMRPQQESWGQGTAMNASAGTPSPAGTPSAFQASPGAVARPTPPPYSLPARQDGVLGSAGGTGSSSSPSPFGSSTVFPQFSAITPGSQASLPSVLSPVGGTSTPRLSRPGEETAGQAPSGILGHAPAETKGFGASPGTATFRFGAGGGGVLQGLVSSTPPRAEPTGMPPPTPNTGLKSVFTRGQTAPTPTVASPSPPATTPVFGTPASPASTTGSRVFSAGAGAGASVFGKASAFSAHTTPSPSASAPPSASGDKRGRPDEAHTSDFDARKAKNTRHEAGGGSAQPVQPPVPAPRRSLPAPTRTTTHSHRTGARIGAPRASTTKAYCFAARLFSDCAQKLLDPSPNTQETAGPVLEKIFFDPVIGRAGVHANFEETASEMLAVWQDAQYRHDTGKNAAGKDMADQVSAAWAAAAAIGAQLNMVCTTLMRARVVDAASARSVVSANSSVSELEAYTRVLVAQPEETMLDACKQANRLSHLIKFFFTNHEVSHVPFSVLSPLIRRVRATFDEVQMCAGGEPPIASDLPSALRTTFRTLNKSVRGFIKGDTLSLHSALDRSAVMAYAHLVLEMMAADISNSEDVVRFINAFHKSCPEAAEERFTMYYRVANSYLTSAFAVTAHVQEAATLLAHALILCPDETPQPTQRRLFGQLAAAKLACGEVPQPEDLQRYAIPELLDVVVAMRATSLPLLDVALRRHAAFFIELGVHNMLELARERVSLLLVVKFFQHCGGTQQLDVVEMVKHFGMPYSSTVEANLCWLLPLLMRRQINGVLDGSTLILSKATPFPDYPTDTLLEVDG